MYAGCPAAYMLVATKANPAANRMRDLMTLSTILLASSGPTNGPTALEGRCSRS